MIDWSLNPKKSVLSGKLTDTVSDGKQDRPLAPSKHANKGLPPTLPATGKDEENGGTKANLVTASGDDFLGDQEDLDALEALAAVEDNLKDTPEPASVETVHKQEVIVEVKKD